MQFGGGFDARLSCFVTKMLDKLCPLVLARTTACLNLLEFDRGPDFASRLLHLPVGVGVLILPTHIF